MSSHGARVPPDQRETSRRGVIERWIPIVAAIVALLLLLGAGTLVDAQSGTFRPTPAPLVGRTATTCTVPDDRPVQRETTVAAVASRQAPGRAGKLTGTLITESQPRLALSEQGRGRQLRGPTASLVLRGEGVMATASSGAVLSVGTEGPSAGLQAAPCTASASSHWFPGVGGGESQVSELVLTNPDDAQALVDLRFYGPAGLVVVPGSPGIVVPARGSRTVSLAPPVPMAGPLSVAVRSTQGRVSAMVRDTFNEDAKPLGADWHPASVAPGRAVVIPAVPEGAGARQLVVVNPGTQRAQVSVSVLGTQGAFAPAGAAEVEVPPESSATVTLTTGLAEQSGAIRLSSDQPVTGAVVATSRRPGAQTDAAVQAALPPLVRTGVSAVASLDGGDADLIMSNGSEIDTPISFEVLSFDGVLLRQEDVLVTARATATRRITSASPAYLVVRVPAGSSIYAGLVLSQPEGPVAGIATLGVLSPDVASRAPQTVPDPSTGR